MKTRAATPTDAHGMSAVLTPIIEMWGSKRQSDPDHILERYINAPDRIACTVAECDGRVVGFQSLKLAVPDNPYGVEPGWGIIGTYVALDANRGGIGAALFKVSRDAAQNAGLQWIDATIGDDNDRGLGYYGKMGFLPYRTGDGVICKRYQIT